MSSSSDNPFVRFTAFWWAIGVFSLFGVLLLVTKLFTSDTEEANPLEEAAAAKRYETRAAVDAAQAAGFGYKEVEKGKVVQVPPSVAFEHVGKALLASKPEAVKQDNQIIQGGIVAELKSKEKGIDVDAVNALTPAADAPIDPAVMVDAKATFAFCGSCHGPEGQGIPGAGPPLAGSEWVTGPVSNLIYIQLRGLEGPITVKGEVMTFPAAMQPILAQLNSDDATIAGVLTYVRNSFGNKASAVSPEQVKMMRGEIGKPFMKEDQLIKPTPAAKP